MSGTDWTADGQGDSLAVILRFVGGKIEPGDENRTTNLKLTGEPCCPYDVRRVAFATVGGSYGLIPWPTEVKERSFRG